MYDSSDPEIELYEEVVEDMYQDTPLNTPNSGTVTVAKTPTIPATFHGPTVSDSSRRTVEATDPFAHAPRPVLRYPDELAEMNERPRSGVAATLAPNVGPGMLGSGMTGQPELLEQRMPNVGMSRSMDQSSHKIPVTAVPEREARMRGLFDECPDMYDRDRPMTEPLAVPKHSPSYDGEDERPRSAPMTWVNAITDRVNSLWRYLHGGLSIPAPVLSDTDGDGIARMPQSQEGLTRPDVRQGVPVSPVQIECQEPTDSSSRQTNLAP